MSLWAMMRVGSVTPHTSAGSRPLLAGSAACTPTNLKSGRPMSTRKAWTPTLPVENWTTLRTVSVTWPTPSPRLSREPRACRDLNCWSAIPFPSACDHLTATTDLSQSEFSFDEGVRRKITAMSVVDRPSAREIRRLQTGERRMGAAIAEFKRAGMADADVGAIVAAAGVAHGTFFFHFPTKEHVLLELERREEERMAKQLAQFLKSKHDLASTLNEAVRMVVGLERRLGDLLFKNFLALHFSPTRPPAEDGGDHPLIVAVAQEIADAQERGEADPEVNPM